MLGVALGAPLQLRLGFLFSCGVGLVLLSVEVRVLEEAVFDGELFMACTTALAASDARGVVVVMVEGGGHL